MFMFAEGFLLFLLWPVHVPQPQASKDSFDQGRTESLTQEAAVVNKIVALLLS